MKVAIQSNRKLLRNLNQHLQGVQESLFQKEPISPIQYDQKCIAKKRKEAILPTALCERLKKQADLSRINKN
jgi:hypothetical protein